MAFFTHDPFERMDFAVAYQAEDLIKEGSVVLFQSGTGSILISDVKLNSTMVKDDSCRVWYPRQLITFWATNGVAGTSETFRIEFETDAGRKISEKVTINVIL